MPTDLLLPQVTALDVTDLGVRAEELGYDGLWLGELCGSSAVVKLTNIAATLTISGPAWRFSTSSRGRRRSWR